MTPHDVVSSPSVSRAWRAAHVSASWDERDPLTPTTILAGVLVSVMPLPFGRAGPRPVGSSATPGDRQPPGGVAGAAQLCATVTFLGAAWISGRATGTRISRTPFS